MPTPPAGAALKEDKRGEILADMIAATNLNICNIGNEPTFVRGASRTHIDITLASENLMSHVKNWRVSDEESLSLHRYIMYEVKEKSPRRAQQVCTGWQIKKLNMGKLKLAVKAESDSRQANWQTAAAGAEGYCSKLTHIADKCMPRRNGKHKKPPVYWWSEEIAQLRRDCIKFKRSYQRKRKKRNEQECTDEARRYKESRKSLVKEIKIAKEKCWQQLCLEVERDPW